MDKKSSKTDLNTWISLGIFLFAVLFALLLAFTPFFQTLELKLLDFQFNLKGSAVIDDSPIVIIGIDDQSDDSTPHRWPWPRSYFAHVVENLEEAGAAVIGIDVIFSQADKYGPQHDSLFTDMLRQYDNIVLTGKLLRTGQTFTYSSLIPPYEEFLTENTTWGLAALEADMDGFYRRYPLIETYNGKSIPSFAAQILSLKSGLSETDSLWQDDSYYYIGEYIIPKFDINSMLINYRGPAFTFQYYPFDNILDDEDFDLLDEYDLDSFDDPGDPELGDPPGLKYSGKLKDKIVLIGSTMHELHDNFPTPFLEYTGPDGSKIRAEMPGVEIHANALYTILNQNYIQRAPLALSLFIIIILGLLSFLITRYLPTLWGGLVIVVLLLLFSLLVFISFISWNFRIEIIAPFLVILNSFLGHTVYQYLITQKEKRMLRGAFAHYVPDKVVQEILSNPHKLSLGGEERVVSVLFSDVAGFTSISEVLKPRDLVALLNEYLTVMTDIVLKYNGIIDKYEGDAIMAEFGVPVHFDDHAMAACSAALEMQKELRVLRKRWAKEGRPELHARIGVNTGEVIVGNMGSRDVFDYTVMGDHVNLGARLEGANKFYGTKLMISEFTHEIVKSDFFTRPLDLIRVKGKSKPIKVFELIAERKAQFTSKFIEMLEIYHRGIQTYRERDWIKAKDMFEHCRKLFPEDQPSKIYYNRCVEFLQNPPPDSWDGVITMKEK